MPLVQMLAVLVDPTVDALPPDYTDLETDGGTTVDPTEAARNPNGRRVRTGGSGAAPTRGKKAAPYAGNDTKTVAVGDGATDCTVLVGDNYSGTPAIEITSGPTLAGATAVVAGASGTSKIVYTPPATGTGGTDTIRYRLTATGNSGSAVGKLTVTVTAVPDPKVGGSYPGTVESVLFEDFDFATRLVWTTTFNGVDTQISVAFADVAAEPFGQLVNPRATFCVFVSAGELAAVETTTVGTPITLHLDAAGTPAGTFEASVTLG